jgi:hypothetical protein
VRASVVEFSNLSIEQLNHLDTCCTDTIGSLPSTNAAAKTAVVSTFRTDRMMPSQSRHSRENAHLLRALEPMLGVVDERSEHHVTSLDEWSASAW